MTPVRAKLQRHPASSNAMPITGTPIAEENLAAASNIAVARLRSCGWKPQPDGLGIGGKRGRFSHPQQ